MTLPGPLTRLRTIPADRLDVLLAVAVAVEVQLEAALLVGDDASDQARTLAHAVLLLLPLGVLLRRRAPIVSLLCGQLVFVLVQETGKAVADNLYLPLFIVLLLTFSAAARVRGRRFWLVPLVAFAMGSLAVAIDDYDEALAADILWTSLIFAGAPAAGGRLLASRRRLQQAMREKIERGERERAAQAEQAVREERARIAGDLHDIVAHALSEMVVQATAARRLAPRDPDRARDAFASVEGSGREALAELRRLLGVLRSGDEEIALAPQPSLSHVSSLVRRVQASGLPVSLHVEGDVAALPAGVDATAYRLVQAALGEAGLGGAGRADVVVRYARSAVEVEVRDDGQIDGDDGRGLLGMRERVAVYGGEMRAGRPRDGGHEVFARLPVGDVA